MLTRHSFPMQTETPLGSWAGEHSPAVPTDLQSSWDTDLLSETDPLQRSLA